LSTRARGPLLISAAREVHARAERVFEYLSGLDNHWRLADRWIEVVSLDRAPSAPPGAPPDRGRVTIRGPFGLRRTAITRVLDADPPRSMTGSARIEGGTAARVSWTLEDRGSATDVTLSAELEEATPLDRLLLALGGRAWLQRRFASVLGRLADLFAPGAAIELDHLVVAVTDWSRSNAFYRDVLGAELVEMSRGRWAYRFGGRQLNVYGPGSESTVLPADPVLPGNSDVCFEWPGPIADAMSHLKLHGVEIVEGPVPRRGARGAGTSVYFHDPDGSLLELISYR
jgi:catechol 2,3-dioxygenase-like lactoylglutathione lyase family enzyme